MALIFLSYRRTDAPQACRIQEWLARRLGEDALFMDILGIPLAVDFSEYIRAQITASRLVLALIGRDWSARIAEPGDPVRMEIETALAEKIPVLPVLIGTTPMPGPDDLPPSIRAVALQNAATVGVLHDFHSHMRALLPRIEGLLGAPSRPGATIADPRLVGRACEEIIDFLRTSAKASEETKDWGWWLVGTREFMMPNSFTASLYLHRVARVAELLELHLLLCIWNERGDLEQLCAGWVLQLLEKTPVLALDEQHQIKLRLSDEDPRQIWKMVTDQPLRLSLAYVATVSAAGRG
jgi:hypothetical protein